MTALEVKEQALKETLEYFGGDELAADVFMKYALRDDNDTLIETNPDMMHHRLAKEFARIELNYPNPMSEDEIYNLFKDFEFVIPQGSPLSGVGNDKQLQSLSNCFVIDQPHDSYGGILHTDQEQVQLMKRRGGVGFDISPIRPRGMPTTNAAKTTDGIEVFMERFSNTCREVAQGGRRGALMMTIDCRHPDIETFMDIKRDLKKVTGANISIRFTDEFMDCVENDSEFILRWPVESDIDNAQYTKSVNAKQLWDRFIDAVWTSAEPGALFWDTVIDNGIVDCYADLGFKTISTNPCGEIPLSPYDSCRLMVVNVVSFVKNPFTEFAQFDFSHFRDVVFCAQRLMDDLIDLEAECIDRIVAKINNDSEPDNVKLTELNLWNKIKTATLKGRRTGLGITGLGDCLASLGLCYGSAESIIMTSELYKQLALSAHKSSLNMAVERGAFPLFDYEREKNHPHLIKIMNELNIRENNQNDVEMWKKTGRRNIALTTTAPGGSISCLTQTTSGIEPAFLLSYKRRRKITQGDFTSRVDFTDPMGDKWQEYTVYHHSFKKWMDITGKTAVEDSPYWKGTANDIDWMKSVELQAAAQKWIDHSISKTCNLPSTATREIVHNAYMMAWKTGCKGFTVYRDGCRSGVLVSNDEKSKEKDTKKSDNNRAAPKRPKSLSCDIHRVNIRNNDVTENWMVIVGLLDSKPYEVFAGLPECIEIPKKYKLGTLTKNGKRDGLTTYNLHVPINDDDILVFKDVVNLFDNPTQGAFTRTMSLALRHGVPLQFIVEQLQKDKNSDMFSFARVIARVLKGYIKDGTKASDKTCPECGNNELVYQEGCLSCKCCSWSKCS